ncbi:MAG: hypothetical protein PHW13_01590 [Methylococcales bacterium]|nr:hypothetical protein [Methylococcales bacterium]
MKVLGATVKQRFRLIVCCCLHMLAAGGDFVRADNTDNGYQLGRGYALGETGITLGGYASTHLQALGRDPWNWNISSLSAFVSWDSGSKLRFFSETEVENALSTNDNHNLTTNFTSLHIERLYLDYLLNNQVTIRVGKMLTPIGQWNQIHVDPLVWTTSRPVATTNLFSNYASGVMLQGTVLLGKRLLEYSVYSDYSAVLDPSTSRVQGPVFDNAQGLRLRYEVTDTLKLGLSYADFALLNSTSIRNHLLGMDLAWSYQRFAINSEVVLNMKDPGTDGRRYSHDADELDFSNKSATLNAWQGYIQGVAPLVNSVYAVARYEFFDQDNRGFNPANRKFGQAEVFGLAYRPMPPVVWKLEYRLGKNNAQLAPDGLLASFAVLF